MDQLLHPTLWRTCRVLASDVRLRLLGEVVANPGLTVGELAAACRTPEAVAAQQLRMLAARGLLRPQRSGRWVHYYAAADPMVWSAAPLLASMEAALPDRGSFDAIRMALTAFTHPRRIAIVQALHDAPMIFEALVRRCGISAPALSRHLAKLKRRGVVGVDAQRRYALCPPQSRLAASLLELAIRDRGQAAQTVDAAADARATEN